MKPIRLRIPGDHYTFFNLLQAACNSLKSCPMSAQKWDVGGRVYTIVGSCSFQLLIHDDISDKTVLFSELGSEP